MAEKTRKEQPTISCLINFDNSNTQDLTEEIKVQFQQLNTETLKQISADQQKEMENLNMVMHDIQNANLRLLEKQQQANDQQQNNDQRQNEKSLVEKAKLFNELIVSITQDSVAATAILSYNKYINKNMATDPNKNVNDDSESQLHTFAKVYHILWEIQGEDHLWPFFTKLVNNSLYLQPHFWVQCGFAVGFAIADIIKMIIIAQLMIEHVDAETLQKAVKESIAKINGKIKSDKYSKLPQDEILQILPNDPKV